MRSRSALVSIAAAGGVLLSCGVPQESVGPASTLSATPVTMPSTPSATMPSSNTPVKWSKLTREVERAYYALRPTVGAQVAFNVQNNRLLIDALRPCMKARGFDIREFDLTHDASAVAAVVGQRNPNGVDARWPIPPDPAGARHGLGMAGPLNLDYDAEITDDQPIEVFDEDALAAYSEAYEACLGELGTEPMSFDPTEMMDLHGSFDTVGRETEVLVGFEAIRAEYQACVTAAGFSFGSPNELLDLAKATYGKVPFEDARVFERAIATTDAICREPLYDRIITLNAPGWQAWLDVNAERVRRVEADLTRLALSGG